MTKKVNVGNKVNLHYVGTLDDGTVFDSSKERGEVLTVTVGSGTLIKGFDNALEGMTVGEVKKISLTPSEAYGDRDETLFKNISKEEFPDDFDFKIGETVSGQNELGHPIMATIHTINESDVKLDFNHPMSGKNLNFEIELVSVENG